MNIYSATKFFVITFLLSLSAVSGTMAQTKTAVYDEYLTVLYDKLHESPLQSKFRKMAPMPIGCVYIQRPEHTEKDMRAHFKTMKNLGFNCLKQIMTCPGTTIESVQLIALEEGINPFWYEIGGWATINDGLLKQLNINPKLSMEQIRMHPAMQVYQKDFLKKRILKTTEFINTEKKRPQERTVAYEPEVGERGFGLTDKGKELFVVWVKKTYGTIENLNKAWNQQHAGLAPQQKEPFASWADFDTRWLLVSDNEYRHLRDILRFKVDHSLERMTKSIQDTKAKFDPEHPFRGGGEMSLFYPHAWWGVDMESIAEVMDNAGCFYPSMHLAWHYNEVNHETVRPYYMQAAQMQDYFKGGWAAAIEATGGPQQFSGYKEGNGFTVDEGVMSQFIMSQLAAGFKGFGMWCWNTRSAGWEAGEYALLDRNDEVTPRAIQVGKIGQAMLKYRDELWQARKEPTVGVFTDWDNDAIWAAMSKGGRDKFKQDPISSRIGISRALINANVPYEYVTFKDLKKGLGLRYKAIYLPYQLSVKTELLQVLQEYVQNGGRVIADLPVAWYDEYAALQRTGKGSAFESLFGTSLNDYQFSGVNKKFSVDNMILQGFVADMIPTKAQTIKTYDNQKPAITSYANGKGKAVLLGYEASMMCFKPGNLEAEKFLMNQVVGDFPAKFQCQGAIAYRLASPKADHYFLMNDGPATKASLSFSQFQYKVAKDAVTGEDVDLTSIALADQSARWIRLEKK